MARITPVEHALVLQYAALFAAEQSLEQTFEPHQLVALLNDDVDSNSSNPASLGQRALLLAQLGMLQRLQQAGYLPLVACVPRASGDWLVQLTPAISGLDSFPPTYYNGATNQDRSRTLALEEAVRFPNRAFAEVVSRQLLGTKSCMWMAVPAPACRAPSSKP